MQPIRHCRRFLVQPLFCDSYLTLLSESEFCVHFFARQNESRSSMHGVEVGKAILTSGKFPISHFHCGEGGCNFGRRQLGLFPLVPFSLTAVQPTEPLTRSRTCIGLLM